MSEPTIDINADIWWKQAVVYQIYPRSFADTTGSGLGDIRGISTKMDYLRALGVDAVWLSPFYPSELADGTYLEHLLTASVMLLGNAYIIQ